MHQTQFTINAREQGKKQTLIEPVFFDDFQRVIEIGAVFDNKLDLITRIEPLKICPEVAMIFAAPGAFDIENLDRARIEHAGIEAAASLDEYRVSCLTQPPDQFSAFALLDQGFSTCDFNEPAVILTDLLDHLIKRHLGAACKCVFAVTPDAPQVAPGQPDENAWHSGKGGFTLY